MTTSRMPGVLGHRPRSRALVTRRSPRRHRAWAVSWRCLVTGR
jgi:hypothetical protein